MSKPPRAAHSPTVDEAHRLLDDWARRHAVVTRALETEAARLQQQERGVPDDDQRDRVD